MQLQELSRELIKNSDRAITLKGVWDSKELSFKRMETTGSKQMSKTIVILEVAKMVNILKADMQDIHIEYMADYILEHYYSYTISDITALTDRLVKNNPYGKPILQNLIHELDKYSSEKQEYAVGQRIKENSIHKSDELPTKSQVLQTYEAMRKEANEPKQTQKERDLENLDAHNEKLKELHKLYPKQ